jgi:hypothetical protein
MKSSHRASHITPGNRGMAVIVVLIFISIILMYIAANARTLLWLGRDLQLIEQKQTRRLVSSTSKTNLVQQPQNQSGKNNPTTR